MAIKPMQQIKGLVRISSEENYLFPQGTVIEVFASNKQNPETLPGRWIGSAAVKYDGHFDLFSPGGMDRDCFCEITYKENSITVTGGVFDGTMLMIPVEQEQYRRLTGIEADCVPVVKGNITLGDSYITAVPIHENVFAAVFKSDFESGDPIGQGLINAYGNYEIYIDKSQLESGLLQQSEVSCSDEQFLSGFHISIITADGETIVQSVDIQLDDCCTIVDLHISDKRYFDYFYTELDWLQYLLQQFGIGIGELSNIDPDNNQAIRSLFLTTNIDSYLLLCLIYACGVRSLYGISLNIAYAFSKGINIAIREWAEMDDATLIEIATTSKNNHIIANTDGEQQALSILRSLRTTWIADDKTDDDTPLTGVFSAIFNDDVQRTRQFIDINLQYANEPVEVMWQAVTQQFGPEETARIQSGLQTIAITGMQQEMAVELINNQPPLKDLAVSYQPEDWRALVASVCEMNDKLCIPISIQQIAGDDQELMKEIYGNRLYDLVTDAYSTPILGNKFANGVFEFSEDPQQTAAFIQSHPELDLRMQNVWDFDFEGDTYPVAVRNDLQPVQNLLKVSEGKPQLVTQMLLNGIRSSSDIAELSSEEFVSTYAAAAPTLSVAALQAVHAKAGATSLVVAETKAWVDSAIFTPGIALPGFSVSLWNPNPGPSINPDLETLFGSLDLCNCSECTSMYSPSAYFTDILNFIKSKLETTPLKVYNELIRRRADLIHIDLTCKNTNTVIPYIDLVNELLELVILKHNGIAMPADFKSYQTSGTTLELEAYPEHTYKSAPDGDYISDDTYEAVYDTILSAAVFDSSLPFNLPLEESRTYLSHLGYERHNLMTRYQPVKGYTGISTIPGINEYNTLSEWLHLSRNEADIITKNPNGTLPPDKQAYYGFNGLAPATWMERLLNGYTDPGEEGLNNILKRTAITYKELLELLNTDFLNKAISPTVRPLMIISTNAANQASCQLNELALKYTAGGLTQDAIFDRWYRFLRLKKATGWSAYHLDIVLEALNVTDLNVTDFIRIAHVHKLCTAWRTSPDKITGYLKRISTHVYINYSSDNQNDLPSVYDTLFQNKALFNPPDAAFINPNAIAGTYQERSGTIVAAFNIKEEEFFMLLDFLGISKTSAIPAVTGLNILSRIYGLVLLAKGVQLSVKDTLRLLRLSDTDGPALITATPADLLSVLQAKQTFINSSKALLFSLPETDYLIANRDEEGVYIPQDAAIQLFYESLRAELKKLVAATETSALVSDDLKNALYNICTQQFGTEFGLQSDIAYYLIQEVISITTTLIPPDTPLIDALIRTEFINALEPPPSTGPDPLIPLPITPGNSISIFSFIELYEAYRRIHKIAYLSNRYKLSAAELQFFIDHAAELDVIAIDALPIATPLSTLPLVSGLFRLNDWVKVKGVYNLRLSEYLDILNASLGTASKAEWQQLILDRTEWAGDDLRFLTGSGSGTGVLDTTYSATVANNDFKSGALLLQLFEVMNAVSRIGLTTELTYNALRTNVQMADSGNIRKAAKAKHTDAEWSKVAKPLQDNLREQQRKAMVAYLVVRPQAGDPVGSQMRWKDENGLFAYYLIDVEMQPCMKTSRIKQGISSVQLYMDRAILNLENVGGNPTNHITIRPDLIAQWRSWRKWYRVWEANRKVFLYPENWIEPELRDNKTPFFRELETQLLQDEVKDDKVEDAFRAYLEQVEEVGRLDPVSAYHQIEKDTTNKVIIDRIHVIARTSVMPHRYYYRFLENNEWSPWEKVNADIKSDHVIPVIWNRKLYLFWLTFKFKAVKDGELSSKRNAMRFSNGTEWLEAFDNKPGMRNNSDQSMTLANMPEAFTTVEVTLNWSQYKDKKWLASELSKDLMSLDMAKVVMSQTAQNSYSNTNASKIMAWLTNREEIKMDEFFRNRLYFYHTFENTGNEAAGINFSIMFSPGLDETATGIHSFFWRGDNSKDPYVVRDTEKGYQILAPTSTRFNKMKFVEDPFGDGKLRRDNTSYSAASTTSNSYFSFSTFKVETYPGIVRGSSNVILNTTVNNGQYNVAARASINGDPHYHFHNPMLSEFLFDDVKNTYFVRWEDTLQVATAISQTTAISFGKVTEFVAVAYTGTMAAATSGAFSGAVSGAVSTTSSSLSGNTFANILQTGGYRFHTFYHPQIYSFIRALNKDGIPGLLRIENQRQTDTMNFAGNYQPTSMVLQAYPKNNVQFGLRDAYSIYNWEIFFHAPMLIAQRLSDNQQFEQAQKWYHYVFDPTSNTDENGQYTGAIKRFWKFYPFYKQSTEPVETLSELLAAINNGVSAAVAQVTQWEQHPFNPHLIARMRILAYMKNVLMKYLDNLIAWGDQLFRRDTIESINEATQLYILAANLLGERPKEIPPRAKVAPMTFNELTTGGALDALSNAMVTIESFFAPNTIASTGTGTGAPIYGKMFYFCLPKNDKLMGYWDTVADRLFKIRNCMNIEGMVRQLPLFEPPIDPALLVRATAMGVDINTVLNSVAVASLPHYRFVYMLQKANEFCNDVKSLGGALLSALEKKDGEDLALLRSGHELKMLERIRNIREQQVREAEENLEALRLTKESTEIRYQYYSSRTFMNASEQKHLTSMQTGIVLQGMQTGFEAVAGILTAVPTIHAQALASGLSQSGHSWAALARAASATVGIAAVVNSAKGSMAATLGGYERRRDDWSLQADTASKELEQVDKQILAAEIRLDIARRELANQELQLEQTTETDAYMRSKFTNAELYSWMSGQVAATYFQSYQLAYDLAKRTEECFNNELPVVQAPVGGFVKFGYWDSLRKGLLSGDKLQFDLRKMEATYIDSNRRELELSKSFSLAITDPKALIDLRQDGSCMFSLDKIWYDLDFPGHYLRKIKSVSISIPCIAGPYITVAATLELIKNTLMKTPDENDAGVTVNIATSAIATSSAQNDAGLFELNFRDERYMPFENAGVISCWRLSMMTDAKLRQLDYDTISDVIIHVNYTARHSDLKVEPTVTALNQQLSELSTGIVLPRYFSMKQEFSNDWYAGFSRIVNVPGVGDVGRGMNLTLKRSMFPEYAKGKDISISVADFKLKAKYSGVYKLRYGSTTIELDDDVALNINWLPDETEKAFSFILYKEAGGFPVGIMEEELLDLYFILSYKLG